MRARFVVFGFALLGVCALASEASASPGPSVGDDHPVEELWLEADPDDIDELYTRDPWNDDRFNGEGVHEPSGVQDVLDFRFRGSSTRALPKKSFNIRFDSVKDFLYGSRRMNANAMFTDASMMHERLAWGMWEELEQPASRTRYVDLYINEVYEGLYLHIERVDEDLLENHGLHADGTLVRDNFFGIADLPDSMFAYGDYTNVGDLADFLSSEHSDGSERVRFRNDPEWEDVAELIDWVRTTPAGSQYEDKFHEEFDVENFIDWLAIHTLIADVDSYASDFWLYRDHHDDGPWKIIPWDHDRSFGWYVGATTHTFSYQHDLRLGLRRRSNDTLLITKFLDTPGLRSQFEDRLRELMDDVLTVDWFEQRIDTISDTIHDHVETGPGSDRFDLHPRNHHGELGRHPASAERVLDFVSLRYAFLDRVIDPPAGRAYEGSATVTPSDQGRTVLLTDPNGWTVASIEADSVQGSGRVTATVEHNAGPRGVDRLWTITTQGVNVGGALNLYYRNSFRSGAPVRENWYFEDQTVGNQWDLAVAEAHGRALAPMTSTANAYSNKVSANMQLGPGSRQFAVVDPANPGTVHDQRFTASSGGYPGVVRGRTWLLRDRLSAGAATVQFSFGRPEDTKLMCDWNGDGQKTPTVVRGRQWFFKNSLSGGQADGSFTYGLASDDPMCGDWNGNGQDGPAVIRGREWHLRNNASGGAAHHTFNYGLPTDRPLAGDWNGDGRDTPGIVRGRNWHLRNRPAGGAADMNFPYGLASDVPMAGDWNDSGSDGPGVIRGRTWHLRNTPSSGGAHFTFAYGAVTDQPMSWR